MLKWPIARVPAILMDFINRPNGETDCIYEANSREIGRGPDGFQFTSIQNTNEENGHSSRFWLVS